MASLDLNNLLDGSGNARHLMLGGQGVPAAAADPWGVGLAGLTLDGRQCYAGRAADFALPSGDYTWELRFKRDTSKNGTLQIVFAEWASQGPSNQNYLYLLYFDTSNRPVYVHSTSASAGSGTTLTGAAVTDGGAHTLSVVNSSGSLSLYVDGTRVAGPTAAGTRATTNGLAPVSFKVGNYDDAANAPAGANPYYGVLGDVRLSDSARYTGASYTPPAAALTADANTLALLPLSGIAGSYLGEPVVVANLLTRAQFATATGGTAGQGGLANPDGPFPTLNGKWAYSFSAFNSLTGTGTWTVWVVVADTLADLLAGSGTLQAAAVRGSDEVNGTVYPWGGTYHAWQGLTSILHSTGASLGAAFSPVPGTTLFSGDDAWVRPLAAGTTLEMYLVRTGSPGRDVYRSTSTDGSTWSTPSLVFASMAQAGYSGSTGEFAATSFGGTSQWGVSDGGYGGAAGARHVVRWGLHSDGTTWIPLGKLISPSGGSYLAAYDASPYHDAANGRLVFLFSNSTNTQPTQPTDSDVGYCYAPVTGVAGGAAPLPLVGGGLVNGGLVNGGIVA